FVSDFFTNDYRASIGTNLFITKINLTNDIHIKLQIWDIAGHEKWINSRHIYYAGTKGAIIVADLTRKDTLEQVEKFWYPDLKNSCSDVPIILLANKNDLQSIIKKPEVEKMGKKIGAKAVLFTSALTGENVEKSFKIIAEQAVFSLN
ncbi:MAG: Rab family GTPase, partial [Promethearchaeota archaeon]